MSFEIRPFTPADYPVLVSIHNAIYPGHRWSEEQIRTWDKLRNPDHLFGRWVLEAGVGHLAGYAYYFQKPTMYDPHALSFNIKIHPSYQAQGFGSALYSQLSAEFERLQIHTVHTTVNGDHQASITFLLRRQFHEEMRAWESWLDVASFDFTRYADVETRLQAAGIKIKTYRELAGDPSLHRRLTELYNELYRDVPQPDQSSDLSVEEFEADVINQPGFRPDALFIAMCEGELVGMTQLYTTQTANDLLMGLTGTRRAFRRRGIARALKLRTIAYAKAQGYAMIKTANASTNRPMLAINEELGFVKQPEWIHFTRTLRAT